MWQACLGQAFAVDGQGYIYGDAGGTIFKMSVDNGAQALMLGKICPLPALAGLDSIGNYYFAGRFDGTQDFGGITLVGGYTNAPVGTNGATGWQAGYPTCFLAEYDPSGNLIGAVSFGQQGGVVSDVTDVLPDYAGGCWVGYRSLWGALAYINVLGAYDWGYDPAALASEHIVRLSEPTYGPGIFLPGCNAIFAADIAGQNQFDGMVCGSLVQGAVVATANASSSDPYLWWQETFSRNAKPVNGHSNDLYVAGTVYSTGQPVLRKCLLDSEGGSIAWDVGLTNEQCVLGGDNAGNLYVGDKYGTLALYDEDGMKLWVTNFGTPVIGIVVDLENNRFISFEDGSIGRLGPDPPPTPPAILEGPQSQTLFVGDTTTLSVVASGSPPLQYTWRLNGADVPGGGMTNLLLRLVTAAMGGTYSVIVSNGAGGAVSSALVRVKSVEFYLGNQMLTNGTYTFSTPPTLTVRSAFTNGLCFYSLDGSPPGTNSLPYGGPFQLTSSATARAIGYSSDFLASEEADPVTAIVSGVTNSLPPAVLRVDQAGDGMSADGFRFTVLSGPEMIWQMMVSTNLSNWVRYATITNVSGHIQVTDPVRSPARFYQARPWP